MVLVINMSLLSLGDISATTNDLNETEANLTSNLDNTLNGTNSTSNSTSNDTKNSSTVNIQNKTEATGDDPYSNIHCIWLTSSDARTVDIAALLKANITDIFVKTNRISDPTYQSVLSALFAKINSTTGGDKLRIHAWITCFKDADDNWIDPQGKYSYQVSVPYTATVKTAYKVWYKGYSYKTYEVKVKKWYKTKYKYRGKWRTKWNYTWTYKTKTKRVYGWIYKWAYKTSYVTKYKTETKYGYSNAYKDNLISFISNITRNYNIDGVHLDYVRYSGSGSNAAYLNSGGTETITTFVKNVYNSVKSVKQKTAVSAALMPEGSANAKYYGQDYTQLSQYLDFLVPMIYKGNYNQGTDWIGKTVKYIVNNSNGKPVVAGLQTYESDENTTPIPATELQNDINTAVANGSSGYALFRYGLINNTYMPVKASLVESSNDSEFTLSQLQTAAETVTSYIETNHKLPSSITVGKAQITIPQFLQLLVKGLLQIQSGTNTPMNLNTVNTPTNPNGSHIYGNINLSEFLNMAESIKSYIDINEIAPNYSSSSLGNVQYSDLIYMYSKILDFYRTNGRLPNYVTVDTSITNTNIPSDLSQYLQTTANCQVTDSRIKSLAASITAGKTSAYDKAVAIFNWVRDNIGYSFYYNTEYGAVGTLNAKTGNCVDTTHLLIALERAVGIPAKYVHGTCTFTSGNTYGHVWAQVWVNGKWYSADGTSSKNTFGAINNWNTATYTLKGIYASLPF